MVKLYAVQSTSSAACYKPRQREEPTGHSNRQLKVLHRPEFGEFQCKKATSHCQCTLCSEHPLVVVSREPLPQDISLRSIEGFIGKGLLNLLTSKSFIVYSQRCRAGREQVGLLAAIHVDDCKTNVVKCHEQVTGNVEKVCFDKASPKSPTVDPLMMMYRSSSTVNQIVARITAREAVLSWEDEGGETHRLWMVDEARDIASITTAFAAVDSVYIADGHHRTASACLLRDSPVVNRKSPNFVTSSKYLTALLYPHDQLNVVSYHRCVRTLNGLCADAFLSAVSELFTVTECDADSSDRPAGDDAIGMYLDHRWYNIEPRLSEYSCASSPLSSIDAQILNDLLFVPVLGVDRPNGANSVEYVHGNEGLAGLQQRVDSGACAVAFAVRRVTVEAIMEVADAGLLLPPKATFFSPKPKGGLISRLQK